MEWAIRYPRFVGLVAVIVVALSFVATIEAVWSLFYDTPLIPYVVEKARDILPTIPAIVALALWGAVTLVAAGLLIAIYRNTKTGKGQEVNDPLGTEPVSNRDALIAAFTELGGRATSYTRAHVVRVGMGGGNLDDGTREELNACIEKAKFRFEEADLAAQKEINILGGLEGMRLNFVSMEIGSRRMQDTDEAYGEAVPNIQMPSIYESVKKAIEFINQGYRPSRN